MFDVKEGQRDGARVRGKLRCLGFLTLLSVSQQQETGPDTMSAETLEIAIGLKLSE